MLPGRRGGQACPVGRHLQSWCENRQCSLERFWNDYNSVLGTNARATGTQGAWGPDGLARMPGTWHNQGCHWVSTRN